MADRDSHEANAVRVERPLPASPEEVFDAWTDPKSLKRIMCPNTVLHARVEADVRVGGKFRIDMVNQEDETIHTGTYVEINRPRKLAFTWRSKYTQDRDTLVTIYFTPDGDETRLLLVHEKLPTEDLRRKHAGGWTSIVERVGDYFRRFKATDEFQTALRLPAPPEKVFRALTTEEGIKGWWTRFCTIRSKVGDENLFRFPGVGGWSKFVINKLVPNQLVQWQCVDCNHPPDLNFNNPKDWIGTSVRFELEPADGATTQLKFTHAGLVPQLECNQSCRNAWWHYLHQSLKTYLGRGEGLPYSDPGATKA